MSDKSKTIELATAMLPTIAASTKGLDVSQSNEYGDAVYKATLPEGLDSSVAAAVHKHDTVFLAATAVDAQRKSVDFMAKKANKGVEVVSHTHDMLGGASVTHNVKRSVERPEFKDASGNVLSQKQTVYGATTSRFTLPVTGAKQLLKEGLEENAKRLA